LYVCGVVHNIGAFVKLLDRDRLVVVPFVAILEVQTSIQSYSFAQFLSKTKYHNLSFDHVPHVVFHSSTQIAIWNPVVVTFLIVGIG
jgi:hypothetical protein